MTFPFGHLGWGAAWSLQACPLRGVYGTHYFGSVRSPEWCVHVCRVSGCGYGGAPMRGPGFVCRVGGFGPCCLSPSRSETCCCGCVYRADPLPVADLIRCSCCGGVCGAGLVFSDGSIRWGCCERVYVADPTLSADLIRWSCCGRSYGAAFSLAAALIRWSCCGRSYGAGPFLAVTLRWNASSKVLTSTGRPGLWWSATGRRRWRHGVWLVLMMTCYLDFLVRGEYKDSDEKKNEQQKTKQKNKTKKTGSGKGQAGGKQGTGSFVSDSCYVLRFSCDNSPLKKNTRRCGCRSNPAKPTSGRQQMTG